MLDTPDPRRHVLTGEALNPDRDTVSLKELLSLFPGFGSSHGSERPAASTDVTQSFDPVSVNQVPEPYRMLLAHEHHMTVTLEKHHAGRVSLTPMRVVTDGNLYARELSLSVGSQVVMAGIMRIRLEYCAPEVRAAIEEAKTPLGRILIENDVLRRIELQSLLRVRMDDGLNELFGVDARSLRAEDSSISRSTTYGRLALIHCDEKPAVELLEIVRP